MMAVARTGLVDTASEASSRFAVSVGEARAAGASHSLGMALAAHAGALLLLGEFAAAEAAVRDAQREQREPHCQRARRQHGHGRDQQGWPDGVRQPLR